MNLKELYALFNGKMDGYATKADLNDYVQKEQGKGLSSNDYTNNDKALVQNSPITVTSTTSPVTTASGKPQKITIYGKSEVVDNDIHSVGEGWATVDLGTQVWYYSGNGLFNAPITPNGVSDQYGNTILCAKYKPGNAYYNTTTDKRICLYGSQLNLWVRDYDYTDAATFKTAMSGVLLCYELADPTQGNALSVKTDNGTGIDGTMATFTTGLPLRGITGGARDSMWCDGTDGEVVKNCNHFKLSDKTWTFNGDLSNQNRSVFYIVLTDMVFPDTTDDILTIICTKFTAVPQSITWEPGQISCQNQHSRLSVIVEPSITTDQQLKQSYGDAKLVYELATPTTIPLTAAEIAQFNVLRTYDPTTAVSINDNPEFEVKAYAGTDNGRAISEMSQDVQSEISALKITQSGTLSLTVADWSSNEQTVTYAHDTSKRNVIDVDASSIEEWASCGVLATAETATSITFSCKTVPENALAFRVTSMGVN